ncbi:MULTISPECIES: hypothetical protein [unclassified Butyrivibrio]|uniref:hypothetical protein n=1 Tax=unclassified Butyrivibrio TaxID=2639466 RepID=UPI0003B37D95|nr:MULTISPECIES: hypothetical protein [unclassified Butyrivibrio]
MAITKTMTEGAPWKHILKFSLPVLAGSLLQHLFIHTACSGGQCSDVQDCFD